MKKTGRILSVLAIFLILSSLVAVWVYPLVQPAIFEFLIGIIIVDINLYQLPFSETLNCLMLLVCAILLMCLVGRRHGGVVIEILLLAFMFLCLPVINLVNDYLCYHIKEGITLYFYSGWEIEKILQWSWETVFSLKGLWRYFYYIQTGGYSYYNVNWFFAFLTMAGANVAQLLLYVVGGIGVGLAVKNKKQD